MPFACCAACGTVVSRPHGLADFGRPVGGCPECGRAMYWTAAPFAQMPAWQSRGNQPRVATTADGRLPS